MKKIVLLVSIIAVLLLVTTVLATEWQDTWNKGKPFEELWSTVAYLQMQIDNIQLIPGPPGPQGEPGASNLDCTTKSNVGTGTVTSTCDAGYTVTGGGCSSYGSVTQLRHSHVSGNGWFCEVMCASCDVTAYAICCRLT